MLKPGLVAFLRPSAWKWRRSYFYSLLDRKMLRISDRLDSTHVAQQMAAQLVLTFIWRHQIHRNATTKHFSSLPCTT